MFTRLCIVIFVRIGQFHTCSKYVGKYCVWSVAVILCGSSGILDFRELYKYYKKYI